MKNKYLLYFFIVIVIIIIISLYFIEIPAPSTKILESYNLNLK